MLKDSSIKLPNFQPKYNQNYIEGKEENDYYELLVNGLKECKEIMAKTNSDIIYKLIDRLLYISFERKGVPSELQTEYLISESIIFEILGQIIRIYPESLEIILTFKSSKIQGNSFISFLLNSVLPLKYIRDKHSFEQNDEWKEKSIQLLKFISFQNVNLNLFRQRILLVEMRRRIVIESLRILEKNIPKISGIEFPPFKNLAKAYSSISILEGYILNDGNSVSFPKENEYLVIKDMILGQHKSIVNVCLKILQESNLHSLQAYYLVECAINILERLTRFINLKKVKSSFKELESVKEVNSSKKEIEVYAAEYKDEEELISELMEEEHKISIKEEDIEFFVMENNVIPEETEKANIPNAEDRSAQRIMRNKIIEKYALKIYLSGEPLDQGKIKDVRCGLASIYERESEKKINNEIMEQIKGIILSEEKLQDSKSKNRKKDPFGYFNYEDNPPEFNEENQLHMFSLFSSEIDMQKMKDTLKNKLIEKLIVFNPEEEIKKENEQPKANKSTEESKKTKENDEMKEFIAKRREEIYGLVPGIQILDDNVLLQIDLECLNGLPPELRYQSIQAIIAQQSSQNVPLPNNSSSANLAPQNSEDARRDEFLLNVNPNLLPYLPPDLQRRVEQLRQIKNNKPQMIDPLEELLLVQDKKDSNEDLIIQAINYQTAEINDSDIESLIKVLYICSPTTIPINYLFANLCRNKSNFYRIMWTLLFILSKHSLYEKHYTTKAKLEGISEMKLSTICFPPVFLFRGIEYHNLTFSMISLRFFSLFDAVLNISPYVCECFLIPCGELIGFKILKSCEKIIEELELKENIMATNLLTELLNLINTENYNKSESQMDALINFITKLFSKFEETGGNKKYISLISKGNVKQICQLFCIDVMSESACKRLAEILIKLSKSEEYAMDIIQEIDKMLDAIRAEVNNEWALLLKQIEKDFSFNELTKEKSISESRFGLFFKLIKAFYDGYATKKQEISHIKLFVNEGDTIEENPLLSSKKQEIIPVSFEEKLAYNIRKSLIEIMKKDNLSETFSLLTDCIYQISRRFPRNDHSEFMLRLLPSIEGLIIVYDNLFADPEEASELLRQIKEIRETKKDKRTELQSKYKKAYAFYKFLDQNHIAFNNLIRQMPENNFQKIIKPFITRFPSLLDFENKRNYFRQEMQKIRNESEFSTIKIVVNRKTIFQDSYGQLSGCSVEDMKEKLRVSFQGEIAVDVGGVTREWYTTLSRAMFNPITGLFIKSAHGNTYQPDPKSSIQENYLGYFRFIGRVIGKALLDEQYLECYFTKALYKTLVGQSLAIQDMEDNDPEFYQGLCWLKENDASSLGCTFTYTWDYFGKVLVKELVKDGANIPVTNENKQLFIVKSCKAKLYEEIKSQIEALLSGLYELVPKEKLAIFDYREIELMISGLPDIDIADLKRNTEYSNYTENTQVIVWFWQVIESFSAKERAEFLQFVTGTTKVPLEGFKSLPGSSGIRKFNIHKVNGEIERLPSAHTW